jgi:hypothetical protein
MWLPDVRVERASRVDLGTIALARGGHVCPRIRRRDGGPLESITYAIFDAYDRCAAAATLSPGPRRDPLAPGKYRLVVRGDDLREHTRTFEVELGKETVVEMEIPGK